MYAMPAVYVYPCVNAGTTAYGCAVNLDGYSDDSDSDEEVAAPASVVEAKQTSAMCKDVNSCVQKQASHTEVACASTAACPTRCVAEPAAEPPPAVDMLQKESDWPTLPGVKAPRPSPASHANARTPWRKACAATSGAGGKSTPEQAGNAKLTAPSPTAAPCQMPVREPAAHPWRGQSIIKASPAAQEVDRSVPKVADDIDVEVASSSEPDAEGCTSAASTSSTADPGSPAAECAELSDDASGKYVAGRRHFDVKADPALNMQVSENSWAAKQRARRLLQNTANDEDVEVTREIKSILNKLTLEKFYYLVDRLLQCRLSTPRHVEILIQEIFEKATTQHHFIDMYANMCTLLHEHFSIHPVSEDPRYSFKRLLLSACQVAFERKPPLHSELADLDGEDRMLAEVKYKTRMLGNIRFIGALLTRSMLSTKILIAICDELLSDPTPEAVESLSVLLTVTGPVFDMPEFALRHVLHDFFERIEAIVNHQATVPRVICLLRDLLDLRAAGWTSQRPQRQEAPMTLGEVAEQYTWTA